MANVIITRNFQVTIPKEIRQKLKLRMGDRVQMHVEGQRIIIEPTSDDVWETCTDFLPENFDEIQKKMREDATERFKRLGIIP
jgi:AbrB family looped-hinge helix DNA binding protein